MLNELIVTASLSLNMHLRGAGESVVERAARGYILPLYWQGAMSASEQKEGPLLPWIEWKGHLKQNESVVRGELIVRLSIDAPAA